LYKIYNRCAEISHSVDCENRIFVWQTENVLFIIRHLTKFAVENMSEEKVAVQFEASPLEKRKAELESGNFDSMIFNEKTACFTKFVEALVDIITLIPVYSYTHSLHLECLNTLIVLMSPQIFLPNSGTFCLLSTTIIRNLSAEKVNMLMKTLLQNFVDQRSIQYEEEEKQTESIVIGLASVVVSGFSAMAFGSKKQNLIKKDTDSKATAARQSCLLLLALCMQKSHDEKKLNPFQESLSLFRHVQGPQIVPNGSENGIIKKLSFHINLSRLYTTICKNLTSEITTLLLFNLIHHNRDVRAFILSKTDIESFIIPILKILYNAPEQSSNHIYMAIIILLMLTEDNHFNKSVHEVPMTDVKWYIDRTLNEVSLGDLIILVLIRLVQFNISQMRDQYLHYNCLAALANMSCYFKKLHSYACQRIFGMLSMLASKMTKLSVKKQEEQLAENMENFENLQNLSDQPQHTVVEVATTNMGLEVMKEITRLLLEIVNSCLTGTSLRQNSNLIYALLQSRATFEKLHNLSFFDDLLHNVHTLSEFFDSRLEEMRQPTMTVEEVNFFIEEVVLQIPSHRLRKYPELKYNYIEVERPEEFFVPYVWSLIYNKSGIFWNPNCIQLFETE